MIEAMIGPATVAMAGFAALWPLSLKWRDASVVDFWWGPGFAAMALVAWWQAGQPITGPAALLALLVCVWGVRLGIVLGARRLREGVEDPRYTEIRDAHEPGFWWKSLFIVFGLQGLIQIGLGSGMVAAMALGSEPIGIASLLAGLVATGAIMAEALSDWQLDRFRRTHPHGGLLTTGLRRIVRYPSYTAEIAFWSAIAVIAMDAGIAWAPLCPVILAAMLLKLSGVSVLDERLARTRPEFLDYAASTPALFPPLHRARPRASLGNQ